MQNPHGIPVIDDAAFAAFVDAIGPEDASVAIGLFAAELPVRISDILAAAASGNAAMATRQAHAVAGGAATFALPALEAAARDVERAARAGGRLDAMASTVAEAAGPSISLLRRAIDAALKANR